MWRLGGRGALRTWHNQFCLNCFNEETVCDLLDLVGPRRGLSVLTWWVLRYFGSHCKSVITLQPNRKMQKRLEQALYVCILNLERNSNSFGNTLIGGMWSLVLRTYIRWLTFPQHYNLPCCPCVSSVMCRCDLVWLTGQGPVAGSSELSDQDSGRLFDEVIWLTAIYFLYVPCNSHRHNHMFSWVDNYGGADQQNEEASQSASNWSEHCKIRDQENHTIIKFTTKYFNYLHTFLVIG